MATETNNLKNVSADPDESSLTDVEAYTDSFSFDDTDLELDADTCSLEATDDDTAHAAESSEAASASRIEELEYEIERLRGRFSGAEQEISAREELTAILQRDLKDAHKLLGRKERELARAQRDIRRLESRLGELPDLASEEEIQETAALRHRVAELEARLADADRDIAAADARPAEDVAESTPGADSPAVRRLAATERELQDLRGYVDARRAEWQTMERTLESQRQELVAERAETHRLRETIRRQELDMEALDRQRQTLTTEVARTRKRNRHLDERCRALLDDIVEYRDVELPARDEREAALAGRLAESRRSVAELQARVDQLESYGDTLRRQVSEMKNALDATQSGRGRAESSLSALEDRIGELESELTRERRRNEALTADKKEMEARFQQEVRQIRFELDSAQETIVSHESINEQLASDLIDNRTFKQALEGKLSESEAQHIEATEELERRVRMLERQLKDTERKLTGKDEAIAALMSELSSREHSNEASDRIDEIVQQIDERVSGRDNELPEMERERVSRVLIGKFDGQELRFPLFKDRLTIGRTAHNDIQLSAQYISRRHAVILCDDDGTRIVDWGSKNGVYVNGTRVGEQTLRHGDKVAIASAEFLFEERARR